MVQVSEGPFFRDSFFRMFVRKKEIRNGDPNIESKLVYTGFWIHIMAAPPGHVPTPRNSRPCDQGLLTIGFP